MLLIWNDQLIRTSPARCEIDADFVGKLSSSTSVILLIIKCHTNVFPLLPAHGTVHQTGIPVLQLWYMLHKYDVIRCSEDSGLCIPMHSKTGASTARQKEQTPSQTSLKEHLSLLLSVASSTCHSWMLRPQLSAPATGILRS